MFIMIMVIILGTCVSVLTSIYYNTMALQNTYGSVNTYYWAYYWALSSIERWLLMTKIKYPGYEWTWWFVWWKEIWSKSNLFPWKFRRLSNTQNTMIRTVNSLTTNIKWTVDNKTIAAISFIRYKDANPEQYNRNNSDIEKENIWINKGLLFSWNIVPNMWETQTWDDNIIDFNWMFKMKEAKTIVRWLVKWPGNEQAWDAYKERAYSQWTYFEFWNKDGAYSSNPRPTTKWTTSSPNFTPQNE